MKSYFIEHRNDVYNKKQMYSYITGFLLGDGGLWKPKSNRKTEYRKPKPINALYVQSQITEHLDYVLWQAKILSQISKVRILFIEANGMHKCSTRLATMSNPIYTVIYDRMYLQGRKTITYHDANLITLETFAYWLQDDGYLDKFSKTSYRTIISTDSFTESENKMLRDVLADRLNIHGDVVRYKNRFRLRFNRKQTDLFIPQIQEYIAPSFYYKINQTPSLQTVASWYNKYQDDGIVQALLKDNELYRNVIV